VAATLNNLAELYREQGMYAEAEPLYLRAIRIWELSVGPEHHYTAQGLNNLALIYSVPGKYGEAERLPQRALHIRGQALGPQHPDTAQSLGNLAGIYSVQGKYTEAKPLLVRALEIVERTLGPHHPQTNAYHQLYGAILREMGREAEAFQEEVQHHGRTQNRKRGRTQPLSLQKEHDHQFNLVHKRLSNVVERAPENIKQMCSAVLHAWEEAVLEESKAGEAFALYGLPPKAVSQLVPENRIHEGCNPRSWTGEGSEQMKENLYVIDVDQNPFEIALDDDFYSAPLPLKWALQQAFAVTQRRFFTKDGEMKQPDNPACRRIYQGLLSATRALYMSGESE